MQQSNRIHSLDSLRGIAALIVLFHHCLLMTPLFHAAHYNEPYDNRWVTAFTNTILHTFWAGSEAVLLFFILSGFVLAIPFIHAKPFSYPEYMIKRFCRIYIPYISVMIIAVLLMIIFADFKGHSGLIPSFSERRWAHPISWEAVISYLLMLGYDNTNVDGPTWSLVHEMRISFFFPLLMLLVLKLSWKKAIVFGFALSMSLSAGLAAVNTFVENPMYQDIVNSFKDTFFYTTFFIIGAVFAKYYKKVIPAFTNIPAFIKILLFLLALILFNIDEVFSALQNEHGILTMPIKAGSDWIASIGVLIIFLFAIDSKRVKDLLTKRVFLWLGKVSYSLYLTHMVVLITLMYTLGKIIPYYFVLVIVPFLSIAVATVTHTYIEKPAQKLGNYLTAKKKQKLVITPKQSIISKNP